jgi:hypothetical protein
MATRLGSQRPAFARSRRLEARRHSRTNSRSVRRTAVAVTPAGQTVTLWGNWPCSTCTAELEAAVHPPSGSWGTPVTLGTNLDLSDGGLVIGTDGAGNVIAGWSANPGLTRCYHRQRA